MAFDSNRLTPSALLKAGALPSGNLARNSGLLLVLPNSKGASSILRPLRFATAWICAVSYGTTDTGRVIEYLCDPRVLGVTVDGSEGHCVCDFFVQLAVFAGMIVNPSRSNAYIRVYPTGRGRAAED